MRGQLGVVATDGAHTGCANNIEDVSFLNPVGLDVLGVNGSHDDE